jgi:predicted adenine nucleotide alpha hydrolase (AANH) superfamily ATPase
MLNKLGVTTMTDYERLKQLLTDFGVEFTEGKYEDEKNFLNNYSYINCSDGSAKVIGYGMFYTEFRFNSTTGEFIQMGAFE